MSDNLSELLGRKGLQENLFDKLGNLAQPAGTPDEKELALLAEEFLIGKANTFGTASFYDFLKPGEEIWLFIPKNRNASLFLYEDGELISSHVYNEWQSEPEFDSSDFGIRISNFGF